jgi:hypothetical protein
MAVLDLTTEQIIALVQQLSPEEKQKVFKILQEEPKETQHPWLKFAGKYKDDPQFEEMLANIALERENISETENL